jgi:group I intron endonuclease
MIKNKINGKMYIGQTCKDDINIRWKRHKQRRNSNECPNLYKAFRKYGIDTFDFKIICICFDKACDDLEIHYISKYNTISPNGYNLDGGGHINKVVHEDTRKKISEALTGKKHSYERIQKMRLALIGFKHTEESKKKMSESRKGIKMSEQTKLNMSNGQKGHAVTEYTKQQVADANKKRVWTKEMREKISQASKNNPSIHKRVGQYTLDHILIKEYNSIKEAVEITSISRNTITRTCRQEQEKGKGYIWKFI